MLLLPFRVTIPPERQDPQLASTLRGELPGIFNWAVEGLKRLNARGSFVEPALSRESRDEYQRHSNPARMFLMEHYAAKPTGQIATVAAYQQYQTWCSLNGYREMNSAEFGKEMRRAFPSVEKKRVNGPTGRGWAYAGIDVSQESQVIPFPSNISTPNEISAGVETPEAPEADDTETPQATGGAQ